MKTEIRAGQLWVLDPSNVAWRRLALVLSVDRSEYGAVEYIIADLGAHTWKLVSREVHALASFEGWVGRGHAVRLA